MVKMMLKSFACVLGIALFVGCGEAILGPDESNDPEHIFELLWHDLDEHYALFDVRGINWDSLYSEYRPKVTSTTTSEELREVLSGLVEQLDDSHTILYGERDGWTYTSGFTLGAKAIVEQFNLTLIKSKYLGSFTEVSGENNLSFGRIKNRDIGYVLLREEGGADPEGAIKGVIDKLKEHKAIILDLRTNEGGSARYSKIIAGAFSDGEYLIGTLQTRNGPRHGDFDEKTDVTTQRTGSEQYLKPVIVLTNRATISAGEYLTLQMKSFGHVIHMGDTTAGDFSAISARSFLPNGWTYQYSVQMFLLPNGRSLDGVGIAPDVFVKNEKADIEWGTDKVLENAVKYLFDNYGIE